jgi:hypothetical protein
MITYSTLDPEDFEEMFEHIDDPQELDFNNDFYLEVQDEDYDGPYYDGTLLDDTERLISARGRTDMDYDYFGEDEY